jgi:hypothetical protein
VNHLYAIEDIAFADNDPKAAAKKSGPATNARTKMVHWSKLGVDLEAVAARLGLIPKAAIYPSLAIVPHQLPRTPYTFLGPLHSKMFQMWETIQTVAPSSAPPPQLPSLSYRRDHRSILILESTPVECKSKPYLAANPQRRCLSSSAVGYSQRLN